MLPVWSCQITHTCAQSSIANYPIPAEPGKQWTNEVAVEAELHRQRSYNWLPARGQRGQQEAEGGGVWEFLWGMTEMGGGAALHPVCASGEDQMCAILVIDSLGISLLQRTYGHTFFLFIVLTLLVFCKLEKTIPKSKFLCETRLSLT